MTGFVPSDSVEGGWAWADDIYGANYIFLCCEPPAIQQRVREACYDKDIIAMLMGAEGLGSIDAQAGRFFGCTSNGAIVAAIWINPRAGSSTIAHEAFHAAYWVLGDRGLGLTAASEEAWAYYLGWLVRSMVNCVNGNTPPAPPAKPTFPSDPNAPRA